MTDIGAMILREVPPERVVSQAQALAPHLDEVWVVEDLAFAGGISQAAAILEATDDVVVGHGIAPAPFRNPVALAMEWATLARMHPGRVHAGVGHGVPDWMAQIGERVGSPLTLLEETIVAARRLLAGERFSSPGRYVELHDVWLEFPPDPVPPILAGVTGPRSLELSGAVADGTILPEGKGPDDIKEARARIDAGREQAGRDDPHRLTLFTGYYCGDPSLLPPPPEHLPPGWDAVGNSPEQVAARLQTVIDLGIDAVVLVPFGDDKPGQIELAARDIVPLLDR